MSFLAPLAGVSLSKPHSPPLPEEAAAEQSQRAPLLSRPGHGGHGLGVRAPSWGEGQDGVEGAGFPGLAAGTAPGYR